MPTKFISFHSCKGGSCRSTTCLNTIPYLALELGASSARPIILIDADIHSMGMTLLLSEEHEDVFAKTISAKEMFEGTTAPAAPWDDVKNMDDNPYYRQFVPVGRKFGLADNGAVRFLGVRKDDRGSNPNIDPSRGVDCLNRVLNPLTYDEDDYDGEFKGASAVIFDCASGVQHSAKLANKLSRVIVMCMRPSLQFRSSTFYYLKFELPQIKMETFLPTKVILLPTAVPENLSSPAVNELFRRAHGYITEDCEEVQYRNWVPHKDLEFCSDMVTGGVFGIPEVQRFKLEENLLFNLQLLSGDSLADDEKKACERYQKLAQTIKQ